MVDVGGDILQLPHCTTPAAVKTIWSMNIILWPQNKVGHCDPYFMVQWFCLIPWKLFDVWTSYFEIMGQYDPTFNLKINVGDWLIFHGPVILSYISKTWWMSVIFSDNETVWPKLWPQMNIGKHYLYFMVKWFCLISSRLFDGWTYSWYNGSVWHKDWPHQVYVGQWPVFYGPVILHYILKAIV